MKPGNWIVAAFVGLFVVAGVAFDASAQAPTAAPETKQSAPETKAPDTTPSQPAPAAQDRSSSDDKGSPNAPAPAARTDQPQTQPGPSVIERQTETRTERVEREPARFLGMDPVIALIVGAVVFVVIILGMVAMSRREEDHPHSHTV